MTLAELLSSINIYSSHVSADAINLQIKIPTELLLVKLKSYLTDLKHYHDAKDSEKCLKTDGSGIRAHLKEKVLASKVSYMEALNHYKQFFGNDWWQHRLKNNVLSDINDRLATIPASSRLRQALYKKILTDAPYHLM